VTANRIRVYRARVKRDLRNGRPLSPGLFSDPDLAGMMLGELLRSVPGWGFVKTRSTLGRLRISPDRRLRALTERQIAEILRVVPR
jgi:hypothetical protein